MIEMKVFENIGQALVMYAHLGDKLAPEMSMALNRAARGIRTDENREMVKRGISKEEVKDWKFKNAKPGDLESIAVIQGKRLGLEKFGPNPSVPMVRKTTGGVTVNLLGKAVNFRHAFTGNIYGPDLMVWQRKRGARPKAKYYIKDGEKRRLWGRFPLNKLKFISVPQVADNDDIVDIAVTNAQGRFLKQFDHLVDRLLKDYR